jgi:hypothetical protein
MKAFGWDGLEVMRRLGEHVAVGEGLWLIVKEGDLEPEGLEEGLWDRVNRLVGVGEKEIDDK